MQEELKKILPETFPFEKQNYKGDRTIWMIVILLSILSILIVYSASGFMLVNANIKSSEFLLKHFFFIALGFGVVYFTHK